MAKFVEQVKANPLVSMATAFILIMATLTGALSATGQLDALITTQAEHDSDFVPLSESVSEIRSWQKCDRLEQRIVALDDRKWKYEQGGADPEIIREIEKDIKDTKQDFDALKCAEVLAK